MRRGAASTVASLFTTPVQLCPGRLALVDGQRKITYGALSERVRRLAEWLRRRGVGQGMRVAILSENRLEYLEVFLAAAWLGAIVACQNWRLAPPELAHCLRLAEPEVMIVSPRHAALAARAGVDIPTSLVLGEAYETALAESDPDGVASPAELDPEDPLLILYTSGTTGSAERRGDLPSRGDRAQPGHAGGVRHRRRGRFRRLVAALSHGRRRVLARHAHVGRHGVRRRRFRCGAARRDRRQASRSAGCC